MHFYQLCVTLQILDIKVRFRELNIFKEKNALEVFHLPNFFRSVLTNCWCDLWWIVFCVFFNVFVVDKTPWCDLRRPPHWYYFQTAYASQRMIGWELSCTCIVTSRSGRQPSKYGALADLSRATCHVYGRKFDIKTQCKRDKMYVDFGPTV